tara:strand:+ start:2290 stop:3618 length:1329 start_codon:yes stop_codon:yes gene_type:complete
MGADAALISSFSKLANSGKRDYSGQLRAQREESEILTKGISKISDTINKGIQDKNKKKQEDLDAENKVINQNAKFNSQKRRVEFDKFNVINSKELDDGKGLPKGFANEIRVSMRKYSEDFKNANPQEGKDTDALKDAREAASKQMQALEKLIVKTRSEESILQTTSVASSPEVLDKIRKARDIDNHDDVSMEIIGNVPHYTFKVETSEVSRDGLLESKSEDKTYTMEQLQEEYVPEAIETGGVILAQLNDLANLGLTKGGTIPPNVISKNIHSINLALSKDLKVLADIAQRQLEGFELIESKNDTGKWDVGSIAYSFQDDPSLDMAVYEAAGVEVPDLDNDDTVVSPAEAKQVMMDAKNRDIIISTIVDPFYINPNTKKNHFNHALSAQLIANRIGEEGERRHLEGSIWHQNNQIKLKTDNITSTVAAKINSQEGALTITKK